MDNRLSGEGPYIPHIRQAAREEWDDAMVLAWKTFLRFEARDYGPEGVENFKSFLTNSILYRMFLVGSYELFVALEGSRIIGMITVRNVSHVSLMFVDESSHGRGVGRALFDYIKYYIRNEAGGSCITVDSSPVAVGFYEKMGFKATDGPKHEKGIIYTPMLYEF